MISSYGPHRVRHGDVNDGIDDLMGADKADILYSDPPWGEGNIKYWATMNRKMTGEINLPADLDTFLTSIFGIAEKYCQRYLLIEYGVRWRHMIQERGRNAGFTARGIVPIIYSSENLPLDLHIFTKGSQELPQGYAEAIAGTKGYLTNQNAIGPLAAIVGAGGIILDPCCGMGYTAQAGIDYGLSFRGNELNRARLAKTVARFAKGPTKIRARR
ncbi:MAG: hypothetical protein ACOVKC_03195 [Brevundimonas sp.]